MAIKKVIRGVLGAALVAGLSLPAAAELCKSCRGKAYILSIGKCSSCGGQTTSGAFKLCQKCSTEQGKCEHCLALLGGGKRPPQQKPPRPKPIDPKKSATYTFGQWKYSLKITAPGTRSEGKWGRLFYDGKPLPGPQVNDHYRTPWGPVYWVGNPKTRWGGHGWMPSPLPGAKRRGKLLSPPGQPPEVQLTIADNAKTVAVVVGRTIVVSLEGNITTGYGWQTAELTGKAVESLGKPAYATRPHRPGIVGVGGVFTFKFKAVKPGTANLKLVYVRPWEKDTPPEKTFVATVNVRAESRRPPDRRGSEKRPPGKTEK